MLSGHINIMNVVYIYVADKYVPFKLQQKCPENKYFENSHNVGKNEVSNTFKIPLRYGQETKISQHFFWLV